MRSLVQAAAMVLAAMAVAAPVGAADEPPKWAGQWQKIADGPAGKRSGGALVAVGKGDGQESLFLGGEVGDNGAGVQVLDLAKGTWSDDPAAKPPVPRGIHPEYQTTYDPKTGKLYCISYPGQLYTFDVAAKKWTGPTDVPELARTSWHVTAIDPEGRKLVVVAADKDPNNLGWSRTVVLDLDSGKWSRVADPPKDVVDRHKQIVAARDAMADLVGRIRLAWYRDPAGEGTEGEPKELVARLATAMKMPGIAPVTADEKANELSDTRGELGLLRSTIASASLSTALDIARSLKSRVDEEAVRQYPVPCSRRNSPLVYDARNKKYVLFGGDHEDYQMNDTWVLDLAKGAWKRTAPDRAPSPRAGHALVYLPACGRVALYEGYVGSDNTDYACDPARTIQPRQLWLYDVALNRWDLAGVWQDVKGSGGAAANAPPAFPPTTGTFYGYSAQFFAPPPLVVTEGDRLVLFAPPGRPGGGAVWACPVDPAKLDAPGREKLAVAFDQRHYRAGMFRAWFCEEDDRPKPTNLDSLPANQWVRLPDPPRNTAFGCRARDWGTAAWDSRNEQILLWGGGHCVRSSSSVVHYSPVSGRLVESYDADEPYGRNGNGGYDSSILNRPWVDVHSYHTYAFDPPSGLMVSGRGYLYDPAGMDWRRGGRMKTPFHYGWGCTVLQSTPHGVLAWAQRPEDTDKSSLWLLTDANAWTWTDLKPQGKLGRPYCDSEGMTYDSKRDRMLLGFGGGYGKIGDGSITAYDFKTHALEKLTPAGAELGVIHNTREMMYAGHADWVAFAEPFVVGLKKGDDEDKARKLKQWLRIYDCAANRYHLLDAGAGPGSRQSVHGQGWCYDTKRKLIYVLTIHGEPWALRLDPASAKLMDAAPSAPDKE